MESVSIFINNYIAEILLQYCWSYYHLCLIYLIQINCFAGTGSYERHEQEPEAVL